MSHPHIRLNQELHTIVIAERKHVKVRPSTFKYKMFESISKVTSIILCTNKICAYYHGAGFEIALSYVEKWKVSQNEKGSAWTNNYTGNNIFLTPLWVLQYQ